MLNVTILRTACVQSGMYGMLFFGSVPLCLTLERHWLDNRRNISAIPPGTYECIKYSGSKFKDVFLVKDVPDRSGILIHAGNTLADTEGCILVGDSFSQNGVANSRLSMARLNAILPNHFRLIVKDLK